MAYHKTPSVSLPTFNVRDSQETRQHPTEKTHIPLKLYHSVCLSDFAFSNPSNNLMRKWCSERLGAHQNRHSKVLMSASAVAPPLPSVIVPIKWGQQSSPLTKSTGFHAKPPHDFEKVPLPWSQTQIWHKSNQTKLRFPPTDQRSSDLHSFRREALCTNAQGISVLLFLKNLNYYISKGYVMPKHLGSYIFLIILSALK